MPDIPATFRSEQPSKVIRVLSDDGTLDPRHDPRLSESEVLEMYRWMVTTRQLDERLVALQRQGRIGFHVGSLGEEAAIIGAAFAMRKSDWLFPCYREFGAALMRGLPRIRRGALSRSRFPALHRQHVRQRERHRQGPANAQPFDAPRVWLGVGELAGRHANHASRRLFVGRQDRRQRHREPRVLRRRPLQRRRVATGRGRLLRHGPRRPVRPASRTRA